MITKGQKINDRYEIIKSIGEGGMANVYLAQDTILDRKVAIKVLRGDLANDEKFIRRFQREALSASSLSHPNIVEMYDVGEDNGSHYIVMEYIEGKTVKQLLKKRGNLTVSEAVDIMLQLTDGISHAHDSYIIHRDLKPQNIMIQEDGKIKITDFGIAMALNSTQLTQTNSVMGSVHYLPPEQASGKGSTIKCDIYSMGILFYELLTGVLPFKGDNAVEIALKHMKDPIPSVRKQNNNIPQSVENIIIKSTAKNPRNRYNDVKEMYCDLKVCLEQGAMNQEKHVYKYSEHDTDENKDPIPAIRPKKKDDDKKKDTTGDVEVIEEKVAREIERETEENKGGSMKSIIWGLAIILLILVGVFAVILVPSFFGDVEEIEIPDVSGMTVADAEAVLENAGLQVNVDTISIVSNEYEAGLVVKTDPSAGRSVMPDHYITLYESVGEETYTVEDLVGEDASRIQGRLEVYGIKVEIKKIEVEDATDLGEGEIISHEPGEGTILTKDETLVLYVPDIYEKYPDFKEDEWTVEEVEAFAKTYGLKLTKKYTKTDSQEAGTIIRQGRPAGTKIVSGSELIIYIAEPLTIKDPETDEGVESGDGNTGSESIEDEDGVTSNEGSNN